MNPVNKSESTYIIHVTLLPFVQDNIKVLGSVKAVNFLTSQKNHETKKNSVPTKIPDVEKKVIAFTCDLLIPAFIILSEVGVVQYTDCLLISVGLYTQFNKNFRLMHCSIFILVMNPAEKHNMVTNKAQRQTS
jgi:hypothetical protein